MHKPHFTLSAEDAVLLTSARRVEHPLELAPLLRRIPDERDEMRVLAAYEIANNDPRGWAGCAACHRNGNHKKGLVLEFQDGSRASLGRHCGESKHGYEYKKIIEAFDTDTSRGENLRRALNAIDHLIPVAEHVAGLPTLPQVMAIEKVRRDFENRFGRLYQSLAAANGRLYLKTWVTDEEKMIARRRRRDAKAERYIERSKEVTGREPDRAEVEAHFVGDPDFSKEVLKKQVERQVATFSGSPFFTRLKRLNNGVEALVSRTERALQPLDGASSDKITTGALQGAVTRFFQAVADAIELVDAVNEAAAFFSPANLAGVVRWANERQEVKGAGLYKAERGLLICEFQNGPPLKINFPEVFPRIPRGALSVAYAALEGAAQPADGVTSGARVA